MHQGQVRILDPIKKYIKSADLTLFIRSDVTLNSANSTWFAINT